MVLIATEINDALDQMERYVAPDVNKWLDSSET
jgi:hypothetical protein